MRINFKLPEPPKPEPIDKQIQPYIKLALKLFREQNLKETELIKKASVPFGRILFDVRDSYLSSRSKFGRPTIISEYAQSKQGVYFGGKVGVGKTMAMQVMAGVLGGEYVTAPSLSKVFSLKGAEGFWEASKDYLRWDMFIDDLGSEKQVKYFSNTLPMEDLLYKRYNLWQLYGVRTHITTNLSMNQIEKRYDKRVRDRLLEMMCPVVCSGESMRRKK